MHGLGSHSVISRKRRLRGREVRREENSLKTCIKSCITSLDTLSIPKLGNCVNLCGNMKKQTESGISQGARSWHRSCSQDPSLWGNMFLTFLLTQLGLLGFIPFIPCSDTSEKFFGFRDMGTLVGTECEEYGQIR